jgi:hypothetical protein
MLNGKRIVIIGGTTGLGFSQQRRSSVRARGSL